MVRQHGGSPIFRVRAILLVLLLAATSATPARGQTAGSATPEAGVGAALSGVAPLPLSGDRQAEFEAYIDSMLAKSHVPGAALAVVQDGEVAYQQGFGMRELGGSEQVTPDTLMMIGSITKPMTATMAATVVDAGDVAWDTPVVDLLPSFAVADPELTRRLSLRNAFCACTGLPQRDPEFLFNSATLTPERLITSVRDFPLTAPLGEQFQYSNQMFGIGGYAAAAAADPEETDFFAAYDSAMRQRLLDPLGMSRSTVALNEVLATNDYARPHGLDLAGALWSSAAEMARYVQMELAGGRAPDGTRIVSTANLDATWQPQVAIPAPNNPGVPPEFVSMAQGYGLGWVVGDYRGQRLLWHSGETLGFHAQTVILPDADLGLVVLTNGIGADFFTYAVQFRLLELVFDQPATFDPVVTAVLDATARQRAELQQQLGPIDPIAISPYLGRYTNNVLGDADIALAGENLILDAGEFRATLWPLHDAADSTTTYVRRLTCHWVARQPSRSRRTTLRSRRSPTRQPARRISSPPSKDGVQQRRRQHSQQRSPAGSRARHRTRRSMNPTNFGRSTRVRIHSLTRRAAVRGIAGGGLAVALGPFAGSDQCRTAAQNDAGTPVATPSLPATLSDAMQKAFEADVEAALQTFRVPGAAVTLVQGDEIIFNRGFGVRDLASGQPVTPRTRFRNGSITKSMTALLLATLVDEGVCGWDDRVVDLWPEFEAPTPELTQSLRLHDLLGMASGIAESTDLSLAAVEFFMSAGAVSAVDALRSVAALPVIAPPDTTFSYNNTLYAAAAYLGLLAHGTAAESLEETYAAQVQQRVFAPIGMADAAILDDPRPLVDDYAVGYTPDIFGDPLPLPFVSLAGLAPAGSGLSSSTDMARYLITQMHHGVAPGGTNVVSATNLDEMHQPGIALKPTALFPFDLQTDTVALNYCIGWLSETYRDGRQLVWHSGGIDGFAALMGFFPAEQIGFTSLTNMGRGGGLFNLSLQASLLGRLFGLNRELPDFLAGAIPMLAAGTAELAAQTSPVDPAEVTPYLGLYEDGFQLRLDDTGVLFLDHDIRSMPLLALSDGGYVVSAGPDVVLEQPVAFEMDAGNVPVMTITGFSPVRRLTGG